MKWIKNIIFLACLSLLHVYYGYEAVVYWGYDRVLLTDMYTAYLLDIGKFLFIETLIIECFLCLNRIPFLSPVWKIRMGNRLYGKMIKHILALSVFISAYMLVSVLTVGICMQKIDVNLTMPFVLRTFGGLLLFSVYTSAFFSFVYVISRRFTVAFGIVFCVHVGASLIYYNIIYYGFSVTAAAGDHLFGFYAITGAAAVFFLLALRFLTKRAEVLK